MTALFGRVIKQVFTTFDRENISAFRINLGMLKQLVDQLTVTDLTIEPGLLTEETFNIPEKAPCTYVHIFQNNNVAMSVFILRGGYTMPLHDHPMMHGILRGISGKLLVQSYTEVRQPEPVPEVPAVEDENARIYRVRVTVDPGKIVTSTTESAMLSPTEGNYHEITAVGGVAAFFDILSPPYEADIPIYGRRRCNFYRKVTSKESNELLLEKIPAPTSYYCDTGDYVPPDVLKEYLNKMDTNSL